jgi:hypothetical protein
MTKYRLLISVVVCSKFALMASFSYAQGRVLTERQLEAIVSPSLESPQTGRILSGRTEPTSVIPTRNMREFPTSRIERTLHGMWRGRVLGDDKEVSIDYFWIFDTKRGESLIFAQRTGEQTLGDMKPVENAPKFTFLLGAHEGYIPAQSKPQIHEFVKVSDSIEETPRSLQKTTGMRYREGTRPTLSELWRGLLANRYFEGMPAMAFAGGFTTPLLIERVPSEIGPAKISLRWDAEYYGGGATGIRYTQGVPIKGVEYGQFVGTTTQSGDFLVASPGNGKPWKVEALVGGNYDLSFDSVILGPLQ